MSVSYIIPVYNKCAYIENVLAAAYNEMQVTGGEIIVLNDGSTDDSLKVIQNFIQNKENIYLLDKINEGVARTTNIGFNKSQCEYVRFIDGDDIIASGSTIKLINILNKFDVGVVFGRFNVYKSGDDLPEQPDPSRSEAWWVDDPLKRVLTSQAFIPSVSLAKRDQIADCFPLPETYRTSQDFIMSVRFASRTSFAETDAVCCWVPVDVPGRLSGSKAKMFADSTLLLAEEWESGSGKAWPARYSRYAARRMAGRARHYARRHLRKVAFRQAWLLWRIVLSYLPFGRPSAAVLRKIAAVYAEALMMPERYP